MKKLLIMLMFAAPSCKPSLNKNVEDAMKQYDSLVFHTDAKGISQMFTADGEMVDPGVKTIHGKDSIEKFLAQFAGIKVEAQQSTTDSIRRLGDTAFQYGKYYQRVSINNTKEEVHGMFQANWLIKPNGKLLLKRMSAWSTSNK